MLLVASLATASAAAAQMPARSNCNACHSEMEFLRQNTESMTRARAVNVPDSVLATSAHATLACTCHDGLTRFPHRNHATKACASCHEQANNPWLRGVHVPQDGRTGATCTQCHGTHDVASAAELKAKAGIATMNRSCVGCHQAEKLGARAVHADSVLCSGCHGPHDTRPSYDRESRLWASAQLQTCGTCHGEVAQQWQRDDIHARALFTRRTQKGQGLKHRPPTCTNCHGGHSIGDGGGGGSRCIGCHEEYGHAYADSYHGRASELGSQKAATCADCHTAHAIQPADRPGSSVSAANLIATCGRCHEGANAAFTQFEPHLDPHSAQHPIIFWTYKFMTLLLFGTMGFFALHTLLWLNRLAIEKARKHG